jgi:hypothetical protein
MMLLSYVTAAADPYSLVPGAKACAARTRRAHRERVERAALAQDLNPLCYQAPNKSYADMVLAGDPLIKSHTEAAGTCADSGYAKYLRNDPVFKDAGLYEKQKAVSALSLAHAAPHDSLITAFRPSASTWKRTQCGSPSGTHPAVPPGDYTTGEDHSGSDMAPCGADGCVMDKGTTHLECEKMCNTASGCVGYVWDEMGCDGKSANASLCWLKSGWGGAGQNKCRNSRNMGEPASTGADIPSKWAAEVSADKTPLVAYPRPQMVRGAGALDDLRERGDANTWTNLNGLWEWEKTDSAGSPPFGRTLDGSILVPFPVESCLSGVAPASSGEIVQQMWYRLTFDAAPRDGGRALLHFGAVDWQSTVYLNGKALGNHTGGCVARSNNRVSRHCIARTSLRMSLQVRRLLVRRDRRDEAVGQRAARVRLRPVGRGRAAQRQAARLGDRLARRRHVRRTIQHPQRGVACAHHAGVAAGTRPRAASGRRYGWRPCPGRTSAA